MTVRTRFATRASLAALAALALAGCETGSERTAVGGTTLRESLGLSAPPPDPFLTLPRAPLEMPADTASLPAPRPGAASRVEPDASALAQAALTGRAADAGAAPAPSAAEQTLLTAAGADAADPAVREQLVAETPQTQRRFGLDSIFGVPIVQDPAQEAERLDPDVEAERLRSEGLPAPVTPEAALPEDS